MLTGKELTVAFYNIKCAKISKIKIWNELKKENTLHAWRKKCVAGIFDFISQDEKSCVDDSMIT